MSKFDYRDPALERHYCDGLTPEPSDDRTTDYILPDGRTVAIFSDVCHDSPEITYQTSDGSIVIARLAALVDSLPAEFRTEV